MNSICDNCKKTCEPYRIIVFMYDRCNEAYKLIFCSFNCEIDWKSTHIEPRIKIDDTSNFRIPPRPDTENYQEEVTDFKENYNES